MNRPDFDEPEGVVVAFVPAGHGRHGQPVVEVRDDEPPSPFGARRAGDRVVIHPVFLLPFRYGGPEHRQAVAEGRVR